MDSNRVNSAVVGVAYALLIFWIYIVFSAIIFSIPMVRNASIIVAIAIGQMSFLLIFLAYKFVTRQKFDIIAPVKKLSFANLMMVIGVVLFIFPMMLFLGSVADLVFGNPLAPIFGHLLELGYPFGLWILSLAIMPAIFEELLFRGAILHWFRKLPIRKAAILSGFNSKYAFIYNKLHTAFNNILSGVSGAVCGIIRYYLI